MQDENNLLVKIENLILLPCTAVIGACQCRLAKDSASYLEDYLVEFLPT